MVVKETAKLIGNLFVKHMTDHPVNNFEVESRRFSEFNYFWILNLSTTPGWFGKTRLKKVLGSFLDLRFFCANKMFPKAFCALNTKVFEKKSVEHNIIGHYNPSIKIIDIVFYTIYVVCVLILYKSGGT